MYFDDEFEEAGLGVIALVALVLAYFVPAFIASQLGMNAELDQAIAWARLQSNWVFVPLAALYFGASFFLVVAVLAAIYAIGYLIVKGICAAFFWINYKVQEWTAGLVRLFIGLIKLLIWLVSWPVRKVFELVFDAIKALGEKLDARLAEARELRRIYREEYRGDYRSYRAFKAAYDAANGKGRTRRKPQGQKRQTKGNGGRNDPPRRDPDPWTLALKVFGLGANFTQAELVKRYRELMRRAHPDAGGSTEQASAINTAYSVIKKRKGWT